MLKRKKHFKVKYMVVFCFTGLNGGRGTVNMQVCIICPSNIVYLVMNLQGANEVLYVKLQIAKQMSGIATALRLLDTGRQIKVEMWYPLYKIEEFLMWTFLCVCCLSEKW